MEIRDAITMARSAVEEADLPEQWQERAFGEVLKRLLAGDAPTASRPAERAAVAVPGGAVAGSGLARVAARLTVPENALADVFAVEDDSVTLHVASGKIAPTKSRATREVALLMSAARQAAGIDESWTDVSHVRDALSQYSRYDISNFSKYLRETGDLFNFRGKPVQQLRLTRPGWEAAAELVKTLTGSQ